MIIQKLIYEGDFYQVLSNTGESLEILEDTLVSLLLYQGMEIDQDFWEEIQNKDLFSRAKKDALKLLRRRKTSGQVKNTLLDLGYPEDLIFDVIDYMVDYKLIDDLEFAKDYAKDAINLRMDGPVKIRHKLREKFMDQATISQALEDLDQDQFIKNCQILIEKKYGQGPYPLKEKARLVRYLQNKGYTYEQIRQGMD